MDHLFCFFAITECRVLDASSLQVRSQATVSCSQPEHSGLLMFCRAVDWVCRGVVVYYGPSPLGSSARSVSPQNEIWTIVLYEDCVGDIRTFLLIYLFLFFLVSILRHVYVCK